MTWKTLTPSTLAFLKKLHELNVAVQVTEQSPGARMRIRWLVERGYMTQNRAGWAWLTDAGKREVDWQHKVE